MAAIVRNRPRGDGGAGQGGVDVRRCRGVWDGCNWPDGGRLRASSRRSTCVSSKMSRKRNTARRHVEIRRVRVEQTSGPAKDPPLRVGPSLAGKVPNETPQLSRSARWWIPNLRARHVLSPSARCLPIASKNDSIRLISAVVRPITEGQRGAVKLGNEDPYASMHARCAGSRAPARVDAR